RTLAEIAREKAGIIKRGVPVVVGHVEREAADAIAGIAADLQAPICWTRDDVIADAATPGARGGQTVHMRTPAHDYGVVHLALAGSYHAANARRAGPGFAL